MICAVIMDVFRDVAPQLALASLAAFGLALLSAVAGFGGGVQLLPVFTATFGLRMAVPMLALTQLASNGSRVWLNRHDLRWRIVGWFALGAVPLAIAVALILTTAPLPVLKRLLGAFLIAVVIWRRLHRSPEVAHSLASAPPSGLGSALLGSVGPLTAPFFLTYGLTRAAYIGTEAAAALAMHLTKTAAYGAGDLLTTTVLLSGVALTPATLVGAWVGKKITGRISDRVFVLLVEAGLLISGVLFIAGV